MAPATAPWPDTSDALVKIEVLCLLYVGENDAVAQEMMRCAKAIKNCELHILKGLDHCQPFWHIGVSTKLIDDFLTRLHTKS